MNFQIVIPARKNSKRLAGKNLRLLNGKPLVQYSIEIAKQAFKNSVWVNSDDQDILDLSEKLEVNLLSRPKELATDKTPTIDVLKYQLEYFKNNNIACDAIILLQPTSPFRSLSLLQDCIKHFMNSRRDSLATFSVIKKKLDNVKKNKFTPLNYIPGSRSQDLDNLYYENGSIYISKCKSISNNEIITKDVYPYLTNELLFSIDIDTIEDLEYAEFLINKK